MPPRHPEARQSCFSRHSRGLACPYWPFLAKTNQAHNPLISRTFGTQESQVQILSPRPLNSGRQPLLCTYRQVSTFIYPYMALSIKDPEADRLAREVAKATGESLTTAVVQSLRERLARVRRMRGPRLSEELLKIGRRCARLAVKDKRSPDEIIGYDEHGLPR